MNKYTVLLENNDLFGVLGVFCNGHCAQNCCRISKQTSGGFRTCLGGKKISELFWEIRPGSPPTFNKTAENRTFVGNGHNFCARHRTRKLISGGFRACLGVKKMLKEFSKTRPGRAPTTRPKNGRKKIATSRPHRDHPDAPSAETLLFCKTARVILFEMSGGSMGLRHSGRELC